ncbi:MAG: hypothetical protein ACT4N7_10190 [Actinokineospora sp.]
MDRRRRPLSGRRRAIGITVGAAVLGAGLIGLGVVLLRQGLDTADKIASVAGLVIGAASLVVALLSLRGGRKAGTSISAETKVGTVAGEVVGLKTSRTADNIVGKTEAGDVAAGGSVIGVHLVDGTDRDPRDA